MLANGEYVDGSWLLTVHIDQLNTERQVRVLGDWSIGEVITQLTQGLKCPAFEPPGPNEINLRSGTPRIGWSDHGLWWPAKSRWLVKNHLSLNQYGLQADAKLRFVPLYGKLKVQLPDLQIREFSDVCYADSVFRVTLTICRYLNIRHPEELSLSHPISQTELKHARFVPGFVDRRYNTMTQTMKRSPLLRSATIGTSQPQKRNSLPQFDKENNVQTENQPVSRKTSSASSNNSFRLFGPPSIRDKRHSANFQNRLSKTDYMALQKTNFTPGSMHTLAFELRILEDPTLVTSPQIGVEQALHQGLIVRPTGYTQRVRLNSTWLDSARSLMEQGIDMRSLTFDTDLPNTSHTLHRQGTLNWALTSPFQNQSTLSNHPNTLGRVPSPTDTGTIKQTSPWVSSEVQVPYLLLRYKYGTFYDLNVKYDAIRINQLYEQAKWCVISETLEVTDEEACLFAALQAQAEIASEQEAHVLDELTNGLQEEADGNQPATNTIKLPSSTANLHKTDGPSTASRETSPLGGYLRHTNNRNMRARNRPLSSVELDSEIDALLDELQNHCLEQTDGMSRRSRSKQRRARPLSQADSVVDEPKEHGIPQLAEYVKVCKPRKFGLKVYKRLFMVLQDSYLKVFKTQEDFHSKSEPAEMVYLPGCEIQTDLCVISEKFNIRLYVPVSKTNLPLSAAFTSTIPDDPVRDDEDGSVGTKFKRRASLLSLTSLSHFGTALGFSPNGLNPMGTNTINSASGLSGVSATVVGLVNEIWLRLPNMESYTNWLAALRLISAINPPPSQTTGTSTTPTTAVATTTTDATSQDNVSPPVSPSFLTLSIFEAERKAISSLIHLLAPIRFKTDKTDGVSDAKSLFSRLDKRLVDYLPIRLGLHKGFHVSLESRRDQVDSGTKKIGTLTSNERPSVHPTTSQSQQLRNNLVQRISNVYSHLRHLTSTQAKLKYISAWEQLPNHGIAFFPARLEITIPLATLFGLDAEGRTEAGGWIPGINRTMSSGNVTVSSSRRIEAIGIGPTRILRCDLGNGEILSSWRLNSIQGWHINWELNELVLMLADPSRTTRVESKRSFSPVQEPPLECVGRVVIRPVDVSVRTVAEFLGGYTFLNLRSPEKNQCLAENIFYKLTTGMPLPSL